MDWNREQTWKINWKMNKNRSISRTFETLKKLHIFRNPLARNLFLIYVWHAATYGDFGFQDLSLKGPAILLFLKILNIEKKLFRFFISLNISQIFLSNFPRISSLRSLHFRARNLHRVNTEFSMDFCQIWLSLKGPFR